MTTARQEKPSVPTPDAASVYQHHLSQMSRPMRVAVERYVAELEARAVQVVELERELAESESEREKLVALLEKERALRAAIDSAFETGKGEALGAKFSTQKHALTDDAAPSPAAGAVALAEPWVRKGWRWAQWCRWRVLYQPGQSGDDFIAAIGPGEYMLWERGEDDDPILRNVVDERSEAAVWNAICARGWHGLTPADAVGGTLPAAAASADVHGLGEGWRVKPDAAGFSFTEGWEHSGDSVWIGRHVASGKWSAWVKVSRDTSDKMEPQDHLFDTAAEAARLALGTAPAVVRGDGVAYEDTPFPGAWPSAMPLDTDSRLDSIEQRLAQLEAAAGKKAGA